MPENICDSFCSPWWATVCGGAKYVRMIDIFFWPPMVKNPPAMQETWLWSLGWDDPLEKRMATLSSILAWEIPWTEEPGRLQTRGHKKIGHNLVPKQQQYPLWTYIPSSLCIHPSVNKICIQFNSVAQSCPTLCGPMNRSMPGLPAQH